MPDTALAAQLAEAQAQLAGAQAQLAEAQALYEQLQSGEVDEEEGGEEESF